jgi:amphi-Trp domain-containing protein
MSRSSTTRPNVFAKLRRLADALKQGKAFEIQIAGQRVYMPASATVEFEFELQGNDEEIEIELKWTKR